MNWNPQGNLKVGRLKSTWKRELQNELKKEINKTFSEASTVAASKEKGKDLMHAWPTVYLEINGNDDKYTYLLMESCRTSHCHTNKAKVRQL